MTEVIVFPDLVKAGMSYLRDRLTARGDAATVAQKIPSPRPARMVRLTIAGGLRVGLTLQETRLLVECWDTTEFKAYQLAALCAAELEVATRSQSPIAPSVWVSGTPEDFSVPVNFPDPLTDNPRFQFTANLTLTGSAI